MCVEITKQSFWIGSGDSCDWKITDLIKCNRIDGKHAKVFYNVHESSWEILNYSPHGIYVNDTLFGFQSEEAHVATSTSTLEGMHELLEMNERAIDEYIRTHSAELYNIDLVSIITCVKLTIYISPILLSVKCNSSGFIESLFL